MGQFLQLILEGYPNPVDEWLHLKFQKTREIYPRRLEKRRGFSWSLSDQIGESAGNCFVTSNILRFRVSGRSGVLHGVIFLEHIPIHNGVGEGITSVQLQRSSILS